MKKIFSFTKEYRIALSRIFGIIIIFLIVLSSSSFKMPIVLELSTNFLSFIFVLICTFGRLWALTYISGHKTKDLITGGPYSIMRNPLYLFSLIGAIGIGLISQNILVLLSILLLFAFYYPFVIKAEEKGLENVHGEAFTDYKNRTPMFLPKPSLFYEPDYYPIDARLFRRAFFSVVWFPLIFMIVLTIGQLHDAGLVPVLFTVP